MYQRILTAVAVLSLNQAAFANNNADIWKCVDASTLQAENNCVAKTIAKNADNKEFFNQLANKDFAVKRNAMATVTYFPKKNLIEVKSLESNLPPKQVLVAKR